METTGLRYLDLISVVFFDLPDQVRVRVVKIEIEINYQTKTLIFFLTHRYNSRGFGRRGHYYRFFHLFCFMGYSFMCMEDRCQGRGDDQ